MGRFPSPYTVCTVLGCEQPHKSRGLCASHYTKWYRKGLLPPKTPKPTQCKVENCDKTPLAKGFCQRHYREDLEYRRKNGTQPESLRVIPPGHCPRCGKPADKRHLSLCRTQPKIQPGDGDPRHGTSVGRSHHKCTCDLCAEFGRYAARLHRRRNGQQERILVSARSAQRHLRWLMQTYPAYAIGKTIGRSKRSVASILSRRTMDKRLADAIMAVTISDVMPHVAPSSRLPIEPYVRIGEELLAAGWTKHGIERQIGYQGKSMSIFRGHSKRIEARYARALQRLHDEAWRNNTNGFRRHCKCIQVSEPETLHATERQQRSRERRSA